MVDLADIGRSRAGSELANFIVGQRQRKLENLRDNERTSAYANYTNTLADVGENRLRQMREQRIADNKLAPIKAMQDMFPVKGVGDYFVKLAQAYNYVDANGMITSKHAKEIHAQIGTDIHKPNVSGIRLEAAQKEYETLSRASKDKTGKLLKDLGIKEDELPERLNAARVRYSMTAGQHAGYMKSLEADQKRRDAKAKAAQDKLERDRKIAADAEKARHNLATETASGQDRAVKAYLSPAGKVEYFANNVVPPAGYKPYKSETSTKIERKEADLRARLPGFKELATRDPNLAYSKRIRMNDDATIYENARGLPEILPNFTKEIGKRGGPKAAKAAGEVWDDTKELEALLNDPEVSSDLGAISNEFGEIAGGSIWNNAKGAFSNTVKAWMTKHKIAANSKTATALRRIQRMASVDRKTFLGSAVTGTELESTLGWMAAPGDSYDAMINKNNIAMHEAEETFRNWLNLYKNVADMTPWYETFGIKRFNTSNAGIYGLSSEAQNYLKSIGK